GFWSAATNWPAFSDCRRRCDVRSVMELLDDLVARGELSLDVMSTPGAAVQHDTSPDRIPQVVMSRNDPGTCWAIEQSTGRTNPGLAGRTVLPADLTARSSPHRAERRRPNSETQSQRPTPASRCRRLA